MRLALLPAYLGLYLRDREAISTTERLARAAVIGVTVTATFMVVFGLVGLALTLIGAALGGYLLPALQHGDRVRPPGGGPRP